MIFVGFQTGLQRPERRRGAVPEPQGPRARALPRLGRRPRARRRLVARHSVSSAAARERRWSSRRAGSRVEASGQQASRSAEGREHRWAGSRLRRWLAASLFVPGRRPRPTSRGATRFSASGCSASTSTSPTTSLAPSRRRRAAGRVARRAARAPRGRRVLDLPAGRGCTRPSSAGVASWSPASTSRRQRSARPGRGAPAFPATSPARTCARSTSQDGRFDAALILFGQLAVQRPPTSRLSSSGSVRRSRERAARRGGG